MPTSNAPDDGDPIRRAVTAALQRGPVAHDPEMADLWGAVAGIPLLARSPAGARVFWIVPIQAASGVVGFARVELNGSVAQIGRLEASAAFFDGPPATVLHEIRSRHPTAMLAPPQLSYDGSPAKWAWLVKVGDPPTRLVFVTPGGWYERQPGDEVTGKREG